METINHISLASNIVLGSLYFLKIRGYRKLQEANLKLIDRLWAKRAISDSHHDEIQKTDTKALETSFEKEKPIETISEKTIAVIEKKQPLPVPIDEAQPLPECTCMNPSPNMEGICQNCRKGVK